VKAPKWVAPDLEPGELLLWTPGSKDAPRKVQAYPGKSERRRHRRKYAEGELPPERSFFFRGPEGKLNLRAQNLTLFLQLAEGVDDETWEYHRRQGDYSSWFAGAVKDEELSAAAKQVEALDDIDSQKCRAMIRAAIERDYIVVPNALPVPGAS
jgi:hypothetical protein